MNRIPALWGITKKYKLGGAQTGGTLVVPIANFQYGRGYCELLQYQS